MPIHTTPQAVGTGSDHDDLYAFEGSAERAFIAPQTVGTGSDHNDLVETTWQDITGATNLQQVTEDAQTDDVSTVAVVLGVDEGIQATDFVYGDYAVDTEDAQTSDDVAVSVLVSIDESLDADDEVTYDTSNVVIHNIENTQVDDPYTAGLDITAVEDAQTSDTVDPSYLQGGIESADVDDYISMEGVGPAESADAGDIITVDITNSTDETATLEEEVTVDAGASLSEDADAADSVEAFIDYTFIDTVKVQIDALSTYKDTVQVQIGQAPIVAATDFTHPDNVFQATVYLNGTPLQVNGSTDPGADDSLVVVALNDEGLVSGHPCTVISLNVQFEEDRGTFSLETTEPIGDKCDPINVIGFDGYITEVGDGTRESGVTYWTSGVIGTIAMEFPVQQFAETGPLAQLAANQFLQQPSSSAWAPASQIAAALAAQAGVQVTWMSRDTMVTDFLQESAGTVRDAIRSMAQRVGADFLYRGGTKYIVIDPDRSLGTFEISDCRLLIPNTARRMFKCVIPAYKALIYPATEPGADSSITPAFDSEVIFPPDPPKVQGCGSVGSLLTESNTPKLFPLDADYDIPKVQIICKNDGSGQYVTTDTTGDTWYNWGGPIIVKKDKTRWISVSSEDMTAGDTNTDIQDGNFTMNLGFTRKEEQLKNDFIKGIREQAALQKSVLEEDQNRRRFVEKMSGSLSCVFFGGFPLPGMWVTTETEGRTYEGKIKSVSLTSPGTLALTFSQWKLTNFYQPRQAITIANLDQE